jgi:hypothetical protein
MMLNSRSRMRKLASLELADLIKMTTVLILETVSACKLYGKSFFERKPS